MMSENTKRFFHYFLFEIKKAPKGALKQTTNKFPLTYV